MALVLLNYREGGSTAANAAHFVNSTINPKVGPYVGTVGV